MTEWTLWVSVCVCNNKIESFSIYLKYQNCVPINSIQHGNPYYLLHLANHFQEKFSRQNIVGISIVITNYLIKKKNLKYLIAT